MTKTLCIDLRWIDCSGIGTYIKGIMPGIMARLEDVSVVGIGLKSRIQNFEWSSADNFEIVDCAAARYSLAEQLILPFAVPKSTDLFFSPHYPIPLLYRGRLVVTVHDLSHLVLPEIVSSRVKRMYARTMFREVRRRSAIVITNSEFTKSELLILTTGPREDNVVPIHLGVSEEWFNLSAAVAKPVEPYIVHVGNVKPHKNLVRLVDAFTQIMDRIPHKLFIIGQCDDFITGERAEFFSRIKAASNRIRLTGVVEQQKLLELVRNAQALVMPSIYEGFGFPPLEAMAAGVPTIVAMAGSLPEICGDAALYCDPKSIDDIAAKLSNLLADRTLSDELIKRGRQRAKQFSWDSCAEKTASLLRSVLG
jgi:glycosyltransferase involved in cell wall biosynthesis